MNNQNQDNNTSINFEQEVLKMKEQFGGWEALYKKLTEKSTVSLAKSGSKMEACVVIYQEMIKDPKNRRIDIMKAFMDQQGISKDCAGTYIQTIKTRLKKSTEQQ